jgi:hypothetical protein
MIRKLGCIPRTLLATWSAMQICPTRALWRFSAIPTPALTNCFSPFRLLRKDQFPDLVRSLEDLGDDYIENDFTSPTTEEIRNARPIAAVLPQDLMTHATLVATTIFAGAEDNRADREVPLRKVWEQYKSRANDLNRSTAQPFQIYNVL